MKLRVHFQSNPKAPLLFQITEEHYQACAARHPELGPRIEHSISTDQQGYLRGVASADVLVGWGFSREDFSRTAPNVKWIHIIGAGIEHLLPLDWLPPGVEIVNNKGVHAPKVGEYMLMAILMLHNHIPALVSSQGRHEWNELFSTTIAGNTLGIIGVGHMGGTAAARAKSLGMHVLGVRRSGEAHKDVDEMFRPSDLDEVLRRSDIVMICIPQTSETAGLLGRRELGLMKHGAGLINLGRAQVVDYDALRDKLESGALGGAIVDVFDPEPLPADSPLWSTTNLIMTPHVASDDWDTYMPLTLDLLFDNIARHFQGTALRNVVVREREY